jgi:hypothetical protein
MSGRIIISILFSAIVLWAEAQDRHKKAEFLPEQHYFDPLILDPVESQSYGALYAYYEEGEWQNKIYSPLSLGFQLPVVQWDKGEYGFEIGFLAAVFFQFEFVEPTSVFLVNLINTDFKAGIPFTFRKKRFSLRTTLYHVSSHFSEEYIFRYQIDGFSVNKNTYEAIDFHASWQFDRMRYYAGMGIVINSPWDRETWKFQGGLLFRMPVRQGSVFNYIAGADLQLHQEPWWSLNAQLGAGIELSLNPSRTFQCMFQYFNGYLPYTQFTDIKVQYIGVSLIGHPF